jgi:hypothetical protein
MPRYPFPNVPKAPGVPQVNRSSLGGAGPSPQVAGVLALGRLLMSILSPPVWGIFLDTTDEDAEELRLANATRAPDDQLSNILKSTPEAVVVPDSFREFNYKNEFTVSDAPTEAGGFATYNKVGNPFEIGLRLTKGGTLAERTKFLDDVEKISRTTKLYKIITPERTYIRCNISSFEVRRKEAKGAYFLGEVDILFREIRAVTTVSTNDGLLTEKAKQASAAPTKSRGMVRAIDDVNGAIGRVTNRTRGLL